MSGPALRCFALIAALVVGVTEPAPVRATVIGHDGYSAPVAAPISDPFRPPEHFAGPGNRGLEYATRRGQPVVASGAGRVAFAGRVAGRLVVSIDHPDGLRTTYSGFEHIHVGAGQWVPRGHHLGTAMGAFHFGVLAGFAYLDPTLLFGAGHQRARLVPIGRLRPR
jgi:murein DD-endopeptidase MepM/ murein hydrolase activator NlpD